MLGKKSLRSVCAVLASGLVLFSYSSVPMVFAGSFEENTRSKSELQKRKKQLSEELKKASSEVTKEAKNKESLDKQIKVVQEQIDVLNAYINSLDKNIMTLREQISELNRQMDEKIEALKKSLVLIYKAGDTSALDIVLGAKDFEDFLDKADIVRSFSRSINNAIDDLKNDLKNVQSKENEIVQLKKDQESERVNLEKSREMLQNLLDESEKLLNNLQDSEKEVKKAIDQNDAQLKMIDAEIQKYYENQRKAAQQSANNNTNNNTNNNSAPSNANVPIPIKKGGFIWPVPGYKMISSGFSDTQNRSHAHGAIDIAGRAIYGANIVASAAGKVIMVNTTVDSRGQGGGGYGKFVVIDHGNGISTLYGHMSGVAVSKGQSVSQGQVIGNVGSTGFSTGPHLHFEYRVNGVRRNPLEIV